MAVRYPATAQGPVRASGHRREARSPANETDELPVTGEPHGRNVLAWHINQAARPAPQPVQAPASASVPRFEGIEGLRGWLAWSVVAWHVIQFTDLYSPGALFAHSAGVAAIAVEIFMIVSGFVVTHLLVTRQERYGPYLIRRAFRLFPLYLLTMVLGIGATALAAHAVTQLPWAGDRDWSFYRPLLDAYASQRQHFDTHALLHVTLFQGLVPDSTLPFSSVAFLGPAWSLSLEWQFYLVAPVIVASLSRPARALPMIAAMLGGLLAYRMGLLGHFDLPSSFPASVLLFLAGITCRLALDPLRSAIGSPSAVAAVALVLAAIVPAFASILAWTAFFAFLVTMGQPLRGVDRVGSIFCAGIFNSRAARWFGARSYAVYIAHWPILQLVLFLLAGHLPQSRIASAAILAALVVPATLAATEVLHRFVERPMIRVGARVAGRLGGRPRNGAGPTNAAIRPAAFSA